MIRVHGLESESVSHMSMVYKWYGDERGCSLEREMGMSAQGALLV